MTFADIQKVVTDLLSFRAQFAVLLGSAATARFNQDSDVDIAVYFKTAPTASELSVTAAELEKLLDRDCDLVALNTIDPIFGRQVLETGREIFVNDPSFWTLWKAAELSRYPDFKMSRKVIEDNLLNRKKYV